MPQEYHRAAVYCRVSHPHQVKNGQSLEFQRTYLPELARKEYLVDESDIYVEPGISGSKDDRPEYNRLLAKVAEGHYHAVWVVEKSRLSRTDDRAEEQRIIETFQKFGCVIRTPGFTYDFRSIEGEFTNDVQTAVDRMERKRIKYRLASGKATKLKNGGYIGGNPPTGYRSAGRDPATGKVRFEVDPERAEMVAMAYKMTLDGLSLNQIKKELYALGHRTSTGRMIMPATLSDWLRNPHYAGMHHTGMNRSSTAKRAQLIENNDFLPPIVSKEDFFRVQEILNSRSYKRGAPIKHPLSGILLCPSCGNAMKYDCTSRGRQYYVCSSKGGDRICEGKSGKNVNYHRANEAVLGVLVKLAKMIERRSDVNETARRGMVKAPQADRLEQLIKKAEDLKRRIMVQIKEQEENFSVFRKERILELEKQYTELETDIKRQKADKKPVVQIPQGFRLSEMVRGLCSDDIQDLRELFAIVFFTVRWKRDKAKLGEGFRVTRFVTTWGQTVDVRQGRYLVFLD